MKIRSAATIAPAAALHAAAPTLRARVLIGRPTSGRHSSRSWIFCPIRGTTAEQSI